MTVCICPYAGLLQQSEYIMEYLNGSDLTGGSAARKLLHAAVKNYERIYDSKYGGFGQAPKFPTHKGVSPERRQNDLLRLPRS